MNQAQAAGRDDLLACPAEAHSAKADRHRLPTNARFIKIFSIAKTKFKFRWNLQRLLNTAALATFLAILTFCISCRSVNPPPIDFSAPGWRTLSGQAIWTPTRGRTELAGDLLLATNVNGDYLMQLAKTPFPLVTAENVNGRWLIEFGDHKHSWQGQGKPPSRFAWFQLPGALLDGKTASSWRFEKGDMSSWRLENRQTGETLEGGFFP